MINYPDLAAICPLWHEGQCSPLSCCLNGIPALKLVEPVLDNPHLYCYDILKKRREENLVFGYSLSQVFTLPVSLSLFETA